LVFFIANITSREIGPSRSTSSLNLPAVSLNTRIVGATARAVRVGDRFPRLDGRHEIGPSQHSHCGEIVDMASAVPEIARNPEPERPISISSSVSVFRK
jgi:hypothetical protein